MSQHSTGRRLRLAAGAAALLVILAGCANAGADGPAAAQTTGGSTSAPMPSAPTPASSAEPSATPSPMAEESAAPTLAASTPVGIRIPSIDRTADLITTGLRSDGTLEVPPDAEGSPASWYDGSPTPGERGTSVLLGHVNSLSDDSGVFYDLQSVQVGDQVEVTRADGTTAVFEVYRTETFAKDEFPTRDVYFPSAEAEVRLITCDNLDGSAQGFPNNFIVYATLTGTL